jgi:hypothetical protein
MNKKLLTDTQASRHDLKAPGELLLVWQGEPYAS